MAFPNDIEPLTQPEAIGADTRVWPSLGNSYNDAGEFIGFQVLGGNRDGQVISYGDYIAAKQEVLTMDTQHLLGSTSDTRIIRYTIGIVYPGSYTFAITDLYKDEAFHEYR